MSQNNDLSRQLEMLNQNIIELIEVIKHLIQIEETKKQKTKKKSPQLPLTESDIVKLKALFDELYSRWESGKEYEVKNQLEAMPLDDLTRFADANNLTVNKKQKEQILQAIVIRFRERKMLFKNIVGNDKD